MRGNEASTADELAGAARLVREQSAVIAYYKKMYDRASALARIGVWECDLATGALTWTDGVYDLFELPRGSPLERTAIVQYYDDASRREMERLRAAAIRDGGGFALDILIRTALGNARWIRLTADVERENGVSVRIFGAKQDITREKLAQEKVQRLQTELLHASRRSAMGAMASTLAHELNQPLAAISNYAAGARRALGQGGAAQDIVERGLDEIERCAVRAGGIIRGLREMTGDSAVARQPTALNELIREAAVLATADASEAVDLHLELADDIVMTTDPAQVQQVMINLIRNAVEATQGREAREICVRTVQRGAEARISVDDNGPGVAPEFQSSLFDSFVTSKPAAAGIGLPISRTIVEAHGGRIWCERRASGGASFCITLPVAEATPAA